MLEFSACILTLILQGRLKQQPEFKPDRLEYIRLLIDFYVRDMPSESEAAI